MLSAAFSLWLLSRFVDGVVTTKDGAPVAGAQVMFDGDTPIEEMPAPNVVLTGPDGRFRIAAPPFGGTMRLVAYKDGFAPGEGDLGKRPVAIVLGEGFPVGGTVRDPAGHPLAGVAVTAWRSGTWPFGAPDPALSDAGGRFAMRLGEGNWQLTFEKDGYLPRVEVTAPRNVEVALDPATEIRGRVVRKDGSGVADARIFEDNFERARTAADGSFSMPPVKAGSHRIQYKAPGGAAGVADVEAPATDVRLVLEDVATVRGRVVDMAGKPVPSFRVDVAVSESLWLGARDFADPEGRFVWNDAAAGEEIKVLVIADGFVRSSKRAVVIDAGGTAELTFELRRARTLRGK